MTNMTFSFHFHFNRIMINYLQNLNYKMLKKIIQNQIAYYSKSLGLDLQFYFSSGFWISLGTLISFIGGILISALFARIWPPDVYGQYSFFISIFSLITLTALPGMGQIVLQAAAEGKDGVYKEAIKEVLKWSMIGSLTLLLGAIYFFIRFNFDLSIIFLASVFVF